MTSLSASGSVLERHRGRASTETFAQRLGVAPAEYLAILIEGLSPEQVERVGFRLGLSFEQERELLIAADIDLAPPRLRRHIAELRRRAELAERELMRLAEVDPDSWRTCRAASLVHLAPAPEHVEPLPDLRLRSAGALADFVAVSVAADAVRLVAHEPMFSDREPVHGSLVILLGAGESCWGSRQRYRLVLIEGGIALLRHQAAQAAAGIDEFIATASYGPTDPAPTV